MNGWIHGWEDQKNMGGAGYMDARREKKSNGLTSNLGLESVAWMV